MTHKLHLDIFAMKCQIFQIKFMKTIDHLHFRRTQSLRRHVCLNMLLHLSNVFNQC